jgi:DNA polymerase-3 subunit gamma/tau
MNYQVLARKWRPKTFVDVAGQEHVLTALSNSLTLGRIHHAYLFSGTRGVGKTTIARLLAKSLNCHTGITATPCGHCVSCCEIERGCFVDLIEIDAASRTKVEDTRELLDNVQYAPAHGRFKIYLIDEVHMLSRHSFNALLKTLEEPPAHVKFILATTESQKLPVTILSRCLQFYLKALNVEQIQKQLDSVLNAEQVSYDVRALQLLARAAEGSVRDALSLTDQAIALGNGQVTAKTVSSMLGILDDEQPLAIVEALINADGAKAMALVEHIASRGGDWDALLSEIMGLLHQMAMLQLLSSKPDNHYMAIASRLCHLARILPPADLQLYYQIMLTGRKELAYAPNRRMGVEMTLLRALAFHPKAISIEYHTAPDVVTADNNAAKLLPSVSVEDCSNELPVQEVHSAAITSSEPVLPDAMEQVLQARAQLRRQRETTDSAKKNSPIPDYMTESQEVKSTRLPLRRIQPPAVVTEMAVTQPLPRSVLQREKNPQSSKLAEAVIKQDLWAAEIAQLSLPKLVQQLALNAFKQQSESGNLCLHLRSAQRHLNSVSAQKVLADALSELYGSTVNLTIVEDDSPASKTPLEWRQAIYAEQLAEAHRSITGDDNIRTLRLFFDADLDEDSIRPT